MEETEPIEEAEEVEAPRPPREPQDVLPIVAAGSSNNWGMWIFLGVLLVGGVTLFNALNSSREQAGVLSVFQPDEADSRWISALPPLRLPERFVGRSLPAPPLETSVEPAPATRPTAPAQIAEVRPLEPVLPAFNPSPLSPRPELDPPQVMLESRSLPTPQALPDALAGGVERTRASRLARPSLTIPQGTVIPAVLETALDSTQGGGVRALVQRDMFGFDGTRKLIPRGSRLYGEYEAQLNPGQNRALVQRTRLIRPDGVTIALDSPSSDPLGRIGVRGKVDGKLFQRFGNALLQSALDIGVGLAVNQASDGVIVALPGSTQNVRVNNEPERIQPTLKVKHGTSVSVLVARDLDFSTVDS